MAHRRMQRPDWRAHQCHERQYVFAAAVITLCPVLGRRSTSCEPTTATPNAVGLFGRGWSSEYDESIQAYDNNLARFNQSDGRAVYLGTGPRVPRVPLRPLEGDFHGTLVQNGGSGFNGDYDRWQRAGQFNAAGKLISLADRIGNQTTLAYDNGGKLASVTDPFGRVLSVTTNANGQVLSISDSMGIDRHLHLRAEQSIAFRYLRRQLSFSFHL